MRNQRPIFVAAVSVLLCLLAFGFAAEPRQFTVAPRPAAQPATPAASTPLASAPQAPAPAPVRGRPFVMLDAGHGADESGAVLAPALLEKNVNLALARRLQKELEARGIPVALTRASDTGLSTEQRAVSANASHAALYIALHASGSGHGVRFYTALLPAAQPAQARRSFLLWDAAQAPYLEKSHAAAAALSAECASGGLPVRNSAAVLRPLGSAIMAAVAIEVSPLGGSPEELADPEYQQKLAVALAAGISRVRAQWEQAAAEQNVPENAP